MDAGSDAAIAIADSLKKIDMAAGLHTDGRNDGALVELLNSVEALVAADLSTQQGTSHVDHGSWHESMIDREWRHPARRWLTVNAAARLSPSAETCRCWSDTAMVQYTGQRLLSQGAASQFDSLHEGLLVPCRGRPDRRLHRGPNLSQSAHLRAVAG